MTEDAWQCNAFINIQYESDNVQIARVKDLSEALERFPVFHLILTLKKSRLKKKSLGQNLDIYHIRSQLSGLKWNFLCPWTGSSLSDILQTETKLSKPVSKPMWKQKDSVTRGSKHWHKLSQGLSPKIRLTDNESLLNVGLILCLLMGRHKLLVCTLPVFWNCFHAASFFIAFKFTSFKNKFY